MGVYVCFPQENDIPDSDLPIRGIGKMVSRFKVLNHHNCCVLKNKSCWDGLYTYTRCCFWKRLGEAARKVAPLSNTNTQTFNVAEAVKDCPAVLLDLGWNIGKFPIQYIAEKPPAAMLFGGTPLFRELGEVPVDYTPSNQDLCVVGLEPNTRMRNAHDFVEKELSKFVKKVTILKGAAVSTEEGEASFYLRDWDDDETIKSSKQSSLNPSDARGPRGGETLENLKVRTLSIQKILETIRGSGTKILVVKMDVEGSEYPLLEKTIIEGTWCSLRDLAGIKVTLLLDFHAVVGVNSSYAEKEVRDSFQTLAPIFLRKCGVHVILASHLLPHNDWLFPATPQKFHLGEQSDIGRSDIY